MGLLPLVAVFALQADPVEAADTRRLESSEHGGHALVEHDFPCTVSEGNGSLVLGMSGKVQVITPAGVNHVICLDASVSPTEGGAVVFDHRSTAELFGILLPDDSWDITSHWRNVVTPSGVSIQFAHSEHTAPGQAANPPRPGKAD